MVEIKVAAAIYSMVMGRFLTRFMAAALRSVLFIWNDFITYSPVGVGCIPAA